MVANEVKQLANVTHTTAENVIERVRSIKSSSDETVHATTECAGLVRKTHDSQGTIASAVEEQRAIVAQLSRQATILAEEAHLLASALTSDNASTPVFTNGPAQFSAGNAVELHEDRRAERQSNNTGKRVQRSNRRKSLTIASYSALN